MNIENQIKLAAHEKLIACITRSARCIVLDLNESIIRFRAYFFDEPTTLEKDYIKDALNEIVMEFPGLKKGQNIVEKSNDSVRALIRGGYCIFALAEEFDKSC